MHVLWECPVYDIDIIIFMEELDNLLEALGVLKSLVHSENRLYLRV